jgi:hypothetical protein
MIRIQHGFLICLALLMSSMVLTGCADVEQRIYEKAIKDAAVRGPGWDAPLAPLPEGSFLVSTFTDESVLDVRSGYVWVAPAHELQQRCKEKRDTVLALEQILGLPPQKNPRPGHEWRVYVFAVNSQELFRPCPGGVAPASSAERPRCQLGVAIDPELDQEFTRFLLEQWWSSHRATVEPDHDPELGYPWTGMGWTYDWNPASKTHVGVSEFVVKKQAVVSDVRAMTPAEFCNSTT